MTAVRWILHESGWLLPTSGAPAARLEVDGKAVVSISWTRKKSLTFEGADVGADSLITVPYTVLEELVWRAQRWHWRPSGTLGVTTGRHK